MLYEELKKVLSDPLRAWTRKEQVDAICKKYRIQDFYELTADEKFELWNIAINSKIFNLSACFGHLWLSLDQSRDLIPRLLKSAQKQKGGGAYLFIIANHHFLDMHMLPPEILQDLYRFASQEGHEKLFNLLNDREGSLLRGLSESFVMEVLLTRVSLGHSVRDMYALVTNVFGDDFLYKHIRINDASIGNFVYLDSNLARVTFGVETAVIAKPTENGMSVLLYCRDVDMRQRQFMYDLFSAIQKRNTQSKMSVDRLMCIPEEVSDAPSTMLTYVGGVQNIGGSIVPYERSSSSWGGAF